MRFHDSLVAIMAAQVFVCGSAVAQDRAGPSRVDVVFVGPEWEGTTLRERIHGWLDGRTDLRFAWREYLPGAEVVEPERTEGVRVWVTLLTSRQARLFFTVALREGGELKYLERDVQLPNGLDEIGQERLAQVLHSAIWALWEGRDETPRSDIVEKIKRDHAPPARVAPPPRPPEQRRARAPRRVPGASPSHSAGPATSWTLALGYAGSGRGDEGVAHGPLVRVGVLPAFAPWVELSAAGQYHWPRRLEEAVVVDLQESQLSMNLAVTWPTDDMVGVRAAVGAGVEFVRYEPVRARSAHWELGGSERERRPYLLWQLGTEWRLASSWRLRGMLALDTPFVRTHYDVRSANGRRTLFSASPWQPGARLELVWRAPGS